MTLPELASFLIFSWISGFGASVIISIFVSKMRLVF
jgi:hypothetical protein